MQGFDYVGYDYNQGYHQPEKTAWPIYKCFMLICILIVIFIIAIVLAIVIPIVVTTHDNNYNSTYAQSVIASRFNVSYVVSTDTRAADDDLHLDTVNKTKMARSFENSLGLNDSNILNIHGITQTTAVASNSSDRRRKRAVECDASTGITGGRALIFDFNLTKAVDGSCSDEQCKNSTISEIYNKFQTIRSLSINFDDVLRSLQLCSFGVTERPDNTTTTTVSTDSTTIASSVITDIVTQTVLVNVTGSITNSSSTAISTTSSTPVMTTRPTTLAVINTTIITVNVTTVVVLTDTTIAAVDDTTASDDTTNSETTNGAVVINGEATTEAFFINGETK